MKHPEMKTKRAHARRRRRGLVTVVVAEQNGGYARWRRRIHGVTATVAVVAKWCGGGGVTAAGAEELQRWRWGSRGAARYARTTRRSDSDAAREAAPRTKDRDADVQRWERTTTRSL